jgi:hypothetical protein
LPHSYIYPLWARFNKNRELAPLMLTHFLPIEPVEQNLPFKLEFALNVPGTILVVSLDKSTTGRED